MTRAELTIEDIQAAAMRALETLEGNNLYTPGPWPITVRPFAIPPTVIYSAADGKTYERPMSLEVVGEVLNCVLSDRREVEPRTLWIPVESDVAPAFVFSGDLTKPTTWKGLIFRAGEYRERGLTFTGEDLKGMVAKFPAEGVPVKSEHEDSLWDLAFAKHGARLIRIWTEQGDTELHGEFRTPGWLDCAFEGIRKTVSVGLTQAFDAIREISLVLNPRVVDAHVYRKAATAFKASPDFATFAASHPREAALVTEASQAAPAPATEDMDKTKLSARLKAFFAGMTPEQRAALTDEQITAAVFSDPPSDSSAPTLDPAIRAQIDQLTAGVAEDRASFARERADQRDTDDAGKFFVEQLRAGRVAPTDEAEVLSDFANARFRDRHSIQNFNADTPGDAEKALRERYGKKQVQFRVGGGTIDSTAQPRIDALSPLGVFADDFKKEDAK